MVKQFLLRQATIECSTPRRYNININYISLYCAKYPKYSLAPSPFPDMPLARPYFTLPFARMALMMASADSACIMPPLYSTWGGGWGHFYFFIFLFLHRVKRGVYRESIELDDWKKGIECLSNAVKKMEDHHWARSTKLVRERRKLAVNRWCCARQAFSLSCVSLISRK